MPYYRSDWDVEESLGSMDFGLPVNLDPAVRGDELPPDFEFMDSTVIGEILISGPNVLDDLDQLFSENSADGHADNAQKFEEYARSLGKRMIYLAKAGYVLVPFYPSFPIRPQTERADKILKSYQRGLGYSRINAKTKEFSDTDTRSITLLRALDADDEMRFVALHRSAFPAGSRLKKGEIARLVLQDRKTFGAVAESYTPTSYLKRAIEEARRMASRAIMPA